jgi:hypothetical protein
VGKKRKNVIKISVNNSTLQHIVSWSISLGSLMAGLSFALGDVIPSFESLTFIILILSFVVTLLYIVFVQRRQKNHDKTRFFIFSMIVILSYIIVIGIVSAKFYLAQQLAFSAFWFRILIASNFAVSLVFWEFAKANKLDRIPIYSFIAGVSLASIYFVIANVFNICISYHNDPTASSGYKKRQNHWFLFIRLKFLNSPSLSKFSSRFCFESGSQYIFGDKSNSKIQ